MCGMAVSAKFATQKNYGFQLNFMWQKKVSAVEFEKKCIENTQGLIFQENTISIKENRVVLFYSLNAVLSKIVTWKKWF